MRWRRRPEAHAPHTLAGAYALNAVTAGDRIRFERHLARCRACTGELRELGEATAALAGAVAVDPPAELIEQVIAASARTRQLPPLVGHARAWRRARRGPAPRGVRRGRPAFPRRLASAAAAAFLVAGAVAGGLALNAERDLLAAQSRDHTIAQVLTAPDAVLLTARVRAGGTATVVMSRHDRALVFMTVGLPTLAGARSYQLWLMGPRGDRSVGLLPIPRDGMTSPVIALGLSPGDWVGLTVEPAGGAGTPTSTPILMLKLA